MRARNREQGREESGRKRKKREIIEIKKGLAEKKRERGKGRCQKGCKALGKSSWN